MYGEIARGDIETRLCLLDAWRDWSSVFQYDERGFAAAG